MMWEDEILKKYEIRIVSDFVTTEWKIRTVEPSGKLFWKMCLSEKNELQLLRIL